MILDYDTKFLITQPDFKKAKHDNDEGNSVFPFWSLTLTIFTED